MKRSIRLFIFLIAFRSGEKCWLETLKLSFRNASLCSLGAASWLTASPTGLRSMAWEEIPPVGGRSWVPACDENDVLVLDSSCLRQGEVLKGRCLQTSTLNFKLD